MWAVYATGQFSTSDKMIYQDLNSKISVLPLHPFADENLHAGSIGKCANLSWKLKRLQTLWFDGIGRNNIKPVRERSRDEESVTFGEKTQEEASTG